MTLDLGAIFAENRTLLHSVTNILSPRKPMAIGDIHTSHHSQLKKQVNIIEQQNNIIEGNIIQSCGGIL